MFDEPSFLVQVGHNGHKRAEEALKKNFADGAVLSPADYKYKRNKDLGAQFKQLDGIVLFDPQLYIPRTDRQDLNTYSYFEERGGEDFSTAMFASRSEREELCRDLMAVQDDCSVDAYVSPARFVENFSPEALDRWLDLTESFIKVAKEDGRDIPVFASLPIDGFELTEDTRRNRLLNRVTSLDPDGFYVSVQYNDLDTRLPLKGEENVYAYLKLMLSLRSNRYEVIAAHTHQIAHLLLGIGVNAFASGHYQNLRAFDVDRWVPSDGDEIRQQVVRYYSDELLDAIRVDTDLDELATDEDFDESAIRSNSPYETDLFGGSTSPAGAGWKFSGASWEHYVWTCNEIAERYRKKGIDDRLNSAEEKINKAKELYETIESEVAELESVEEEIYDDWEESLETIESEMNKTRMRMILRRS